MTDSSDELNGDGGANQTDVYLGLNSMTSLGGARPDHFHEFSGRNDCHGGRRLEALWNVGAKNRNGVAASDASASQGVRETEATSPELLVTPTQRTVDNGDAIGMNLSGSVQKGDGC